MNRWKCRSDERLMENTFDTISPRELKENPESNMNLEQRVEALEQAVKALAGGNLTVENDQIYINDALIPGGSIKAAEIKAAGVFHVYEGVQEVRDESGAIRLRTGKI